MRDQIGASAGEVWRALEQNGKPMDIKALKKATTLRTEKEVYAALGWLAKEDKLNFDGGGKDLMVSLK